MFFIRFLLTIVLCAYYNFKSSLNLIFSYVSVIMTPAKDQSSSLVAELSSIVALEAIYALLLAYRDRKLSSLITKVSCLLFTLSAVGLVASTWILRAKPDGKVNSGS